MILNILGKYWFGIYFVIIEFKNLLIIIFGINYFMIKILILFSFRWFSVDEFDVSMIVVNDVVSVSCIIILVEMLV